MTLFGRPSPPKTICLVVFTFPKSANQRLIGHIACRNPRNGSCVSQMTQRFFLISNVAEKSEIIHVLSATDIASVNGMKKHPKGFFTKKLFCLKSRSVGTLCYKETLKGGYCILAPALNIKVKVSTPGLPCPMQIIFSD